MKKYYAKKILKGKWFYDKSALMIVQIFALNYDYNYEIAKADDHLELDEEPELNEIGETYIIKWGDGAFSDLDLCTIDYGGLDLDSAVKKAESKVQDKIDWENR